MQFVITVAAEGWLNWRTATTASMADSPPIDEGFWSSLELARCGPVLFVWLCLAPIVTFVGLMPF